jgi:acetyl-CoA decarbonylase/synthase complex subunit gamma
MALSGLDIFKLLPKTNCGDCKVPTCLAFAMKLAQKKAELSECPHASEEAKTTLGAASEPPIRSIKIGIGAYAVEMGEETVMYRHEKTFVHQTAIAIQINSSESDDQLQKKIEEFESYIVERVGEELTSDLFFISHDSKNEEDFQKTILLVREKSKKGIIVYCRDKELLRTGLEIIKNERPAIFLQDKLTDKDIELAKAFGSTLIITANSFESLSEQVEKATSEGINDLILNLTAEHIGAQIQTNTILRRTALKKNYKPYGFPLINFIKADDRFDLIAESAMYLCKYASIIVLPKCDKAMLFSLFTLRQNIYSDPQKPIQVEPKVYAIGDPTPDSPVFITTNFSLTYFIVSGEIENVGLSSYLVITDCEGQSVLTAWAAGKFSGEKIAKFIKEIKLEDQINTRKIVIPGYVAQISGDLEEHLPGWEVIVGCQEVSDLPEFIKSVELT